MKVQKSREDFQSFEQLKADLFPCLTDEENKKASNRNSSQIGVCLADEAIEELLRDRRRSNA